MRHLSGKEKSSRAADIARRQRVRSFQMSEEGGGCDGGKVADDEDTDDDNNKHPVSPVSTQLAAHPQLVASQTPIRCEGGVDDEDGEMSDTTDATDLFHSDFSHTDLSSFSSASGSSDSSLEEGAAAIIISPDDPQNQETVEL
jgi:hypothetical protein